jgi:hypothetical protein
MIGCLLNRGKIPVRPVTPLAVASDAPVRPARYASRWTDKTTGRVS